MNRKNFSKSELTKISLKDLEKYLKHKNWEGPTEHKNKKISIFKSPKEDKGNHLTLMIPKNEYYEDYHTRINDAINVLAAFENVDPEIILKKISLIIYDKYYFRKWSKRDSRPSEAYNLKKWSNKKSRSRVGIICTIGPSVFEPKKGINKINELIEGGMNIARINLSHFPLDEDKKASYPGFLDKIKETIKAIRKGSDELQTPVNIMLDLKGPEIRVASFTIPDLKKLEPKPKIEITKDLEFTIFTSKTTGRVKVENHVLIVDKADFSKEKQYSFEINENVIKVERCEKKEKKKGNNGKRFDFIVKEIEKINEQLYFETNSAITRKCNGEKKEFSIIDIYEPVLKIKENDELILTAEKEGPTNYKELPVIHLDYDGEFAKDVAAQNAEDDIFLDDGKASFRLNRGKTTKKKYPIVKVIDGNKVEKRKSMNLFNNTCESAQFISDIDRIYLKEIFESEEFKDECPIDSIAVSFVRSSSDLDRIDTMLRLYGLNKDWDIKLVAKIESPHCFLKRYIHDKQRFNQDGPDFASYEEIVNNKLCWAVMVARGDLGVEVNPEKVPSIQNKITDLANIAGKGVIVATQMLLSMVNNKRPSRSDVTDIHDAVMNGADVVMLSEETAKGKYPIDALKRMRKIVDQAVMELMEPVKRDVYLKKITDRGRRETSQIMELLGEPMVNISLESGSPVIFAYALTGGTATKIPRYRPNKPIIAITNNEMAARNMLFYFGIYPLFFEIEIEKGGHSSQDKVKPDFPRDVKEYRAFLSAIIDKAKDEKNDFSLEKLKEITEGKIVFGLLGIDDKSSYLSDRAIVIFRYQERGQEKKQDDTTPKSG